MGLGGSKPVADPSTRVVIVGGGMAGEAIAEALQGSTQVTLIDPLPASFFRIGSLRAAVQPGFEVNVYAPRDRQLAKTALRVGAVTAVDAKARTVTYAPRGGGAAVTLKYDILVLAPGATYAGAAETHGATVAEGRATFTRIQAAVASARRVVVVGGGPVGVEMAGEVKGGPGGADKAVTIVHAGAHLVSAATNGAVGADSTLGTALARRAGQLGITVVTGARAGGPGARGDAAAAAAGLTVVAPGIYAGRADVPTTAGGAPGVPIAADLQIWAVGALRPNTGFLAASGVPLDAAGYIRVEPSLQVVGQPRIFALGDAAATADSKTAYAASQQAPGVVANVVVAAIAAAAGTAPALVPVKAVTAAMMAVPLGPKAGVIRLGSYVLGDWLSSVKHAKLFIPKFLATHKYTQAEITVGVPSLA